MESWKMNYHRNDDSKGPKREATGEINQSWAKFAKSEGAQGEGPLKNDHEDKMCEAKEGARQTKLFIKNKRVEILRPRIRELIMNEERAKQLREEIGGSTYRPNPPQQT
jgi:hypothetical protein